MHFGRIAALFLGLVLVGPIAGASDPEVGEPVPAEGPSDVNLAPLTYDWTVDGVVTGAFTATTVTLLLLKNDLAPLKCKWCAPDALDGNLSKSVVWSNPKTANTISDAMQVVVPVGVMGFGLIQAYRLGDPTAGWADVLLISEATSMAMFANVIVKYVAGRARPYVWQGNPGLYSPPSDANLSFFGGHATLAFAVVVSGGTLFLMQGVPGAPYVLGAGLAVAAFTAYLRMAADQHYLTDVLVGAAVGSLVGWAVPYLFHRPGRHGPPRAGDLVSAPGGVAIAW